MEIKVLNPVIPPDEPSPTGGCDIAAQLCDGGSGPCGPVPPIWCVFDLPIDCTLDNPNAS
ncbi:hypothetical protein JYK00_00225 [Thermosipho ferrireducens]|uniref:Uncharacterized protein n=1 Tax=Thermosipho ferrireducens TaxID=2571116 RepID=A0ABX7S9G5_9BACT|nr:hypothetical protein [Thermosipho ferrireducens]QTA38013.1 hypothetical protein JYK00_00225 [Thermosipho ferrireducens]